MPTSRAVSMSAVRKPPCRSMSPRASACCPVPDLPCREHLDFIVRGVPPGGYIVDELAVHVVYQRLEVGLFLRSQIAGGIAGILELSRVDYDALEFGPNGAGPRSWSTP